MGRPEEGNKQNMLHGASVERRGVGVKNSVLLESISVVETGFLERGCPRFMQANVQDQALAYFFSHFEVSNLSEKLGVFKLSQIVFSCYKIKNYQFNMLH